MIKTKTTELETKTTAVKTMIKTKTTELETKTKTTAVET